MSAFTPLSTSAPRSNGTSVDRQLPPVSGAGAGAVQQQQQQQQQQQLQHHHQQNQQPQQPTGAPQRYSNRAATAIARLTPSFLHPSRPPSANGRRESGHDAGEETPWQPSAGMYGLDLYRSMSPDVSRSDAFETEKPIAAIDIAPDRSHAVLGGRDILRTIRVDPGGGVNEDVNVLRRMSNKPRDQLAIVDVRWSRHHGSLIATAAGSGRIVLYDLNRPSFELVTLHEHVRQVHKLAFHPHGAQFFVSASHDGSIKLWDLNDIRRSNLTFQGPNNGIRDVKWSNTDAFEFATGADSGVVQRWDMRKARAPLLQLNAHDQTCHSIDYHPVSKYLVTTGADKRIKVWDTTRTERRQNPYMHIQAPQSVLNVCWRLGGSSIHVDEGAGDFRPEWSNQIATSYDTKDPRIHIWDLGRPSIPYQEIDNFDLPTSSLLWHSPDLLWSAGGTSNSGRFIQSDVSTAVKPLDRTNVNVLAVAPDGGMTFFSDARLPKAFALPEIQDDILHRARTESSTGDRLSTSLSVMEASSGEGGLLTSRLRNRRRQAANSRQQSLNLRSSETLPAGELQGLINIINSHPTDTYETSQSGAYGHVRGVFDSGAFKHLANSYETIVGGQDPSSSITSADIERTFLANSSEAARVGDDGLAHTWRILAWAVKMELEDRTAAWGLAESKKGKQVQAGSTTDMDAPRSRSRGLSVAVAPGASSKGLAATSVLAESSSNVPTPKVMPQRGGAQVPALPQGSLGDSSEQSGMSFGTEGFSSDESLNGPASGVVASWDAASQQTSAKPVVSEETVVKKPSHSNTTEPEFASELEGLEEQLTARRAAMGNYRSMPRPILRFDNSAGGRLSAVNASYATNPIQTNRPGVGRYDSGESFDLLSGSMDSQGKSPELGSFDDGSYPGRASLESRRNESDGSFKSGLDIAAQTRRIARGSLTSQPQNMVIPSIRTDSQSFESASEDGTRSGTFVEDVELKAARGPKLALPPLLHEEDIDPEFRQDSSVLKTDVLGDSKKRGLEHGRVELMGLGRHDADLPMTEIKPWHASSFLPALLSHYLDRLSSLQLPVFLAMYLYRYYPLIFPTKRPDESRDMTQSPLESSLSSPLTYSRLLAVVLSYHAQLVSLRQFTAAASLRRAFEHIFPEIGIKVSPGTLRAPWCRTCGKLSKGGEKDRCARCRKRWGGCGVCGKLRLQPRRRTESGPRAEESGRNEQQDRVNIRHGLDRRKTGNDKEQEEDRQEEGDADQGDEVGPKSRGGRRKSTTCLRWMYCQSCGHGGHSACLKDWLLRPESEGSCPMPGCGHACGPGARRQEARAELARRKDELTQLRRSNGVLRDEKVVRESRAVKAARPSTLEPGVSDGPGDVAAGGAGAGAAAGTGPTGSNGAAGGSGGIVIPGGGGPAATSSAAAAAANLAVGGIPMESVGSPGMAGMGMGMGAGRSRWRSGRRTGGGRSSTGSGNRGAAIGGGLGPESSSGGGGGAAAGGGYVQALTSSALTSGGIRGMEMEQSVLTIDSETSASEP